MTTYRKIHGRSIQAVTTDPTESVAEGQVWYNTGSETFKSVVSSEAWSSSSSLGSARYDAGGGGIQTAGLCFGGRSPAIPSTNLTEEYNGSGWSAGGNLNLGRQQMFSFGSQTAALGASGYKDSGGPGYRQESEEYNGTAWTEGNNCPIASFAGAGFGIQTAGVACGGRTPSPTNSTAEYDGTSWTSGNNMTTSLQQLSGAGTLTAGVTFGGASSTAKVDVIQEYDGTSWSDAGDLPAARSLAGTSGIQTAAIIFGGNSPSVVNTTLNYDGTSITSNTATLATARYGMSYPSGAPASTNTSAFAAGGYSTTTVGNTEEYNKSANVITAAAWASGGTLPVAVYDNAGAGTKNAGLSFGGDTAPDGKTTATFEYDGSSWTAGGALNTGRRELGGFGLQTAAVAACGGNYPASTLTEEYNGSSWTAGNAASTARTMMGAAGVLTSGVVVGGNPGTMTTTEEYDGTNWSSGGALPVGKQSNDSFGNVVTAIHNAGGNTAPASYVNTSEAYDGTNWTSGPTMTYGADRVSATGSSTSGLVFSGRLGPSTSRTAATMYFDGTSFVSAPSLSAARSGGQASGKGETSNASSFVAGGGGPSRKDTTEEFTGETTAINVKTLTQS